MSTDVGVALMGALASLGARMPPQKRPPMRPWGGSATFGRPDSKNAPAVLPKRCQPQGSTAIPKAIHCHSCYIADLRRVVLCRDGGHSHLSSASEGRGATDARETYSVPPKRPHLVTNAGDTSAVFLVLQGIGDYDFVPLADTR